MENKESNIADLVTASEEIKKIQITINNAVSFLESLE